MKALVAGVAVASGVRLSAPVRDPTRWSLGVVTEIAYYRDYPVDGLEPGVWVGFLWDSGNSSRHELAKMRGPALYGLEVGDRVAFIGDALGYYCEPA